MRILLAVIFMLSLASVPKATAASWCPSLFKKEESFDRARYETERDRLKTFSDEDLYIYLKPESSAEEILAFINRVSPRGHSDLFGIEHAIELRPNRDRLRNILRKHFAEGPFQGRYSLHRVSVDLFALANSPPRFWEVLLQSLSGRGRALVIREFEKDIRRQVFEKGLNRAFEDLGLIRGNTNKEHFRAFLERNANSRKVIQSLFVNAVLNSVGPLPHGVYSAPFVLGGYRIRPTGKQLEEMGRFLSEENGVGLRDYLETNFPGKISRTLAANIVESAAIVGFTYLFVSLYSEYFAGEFEKLYYAVTTTKEQAETVRHSSDADTIRRNHLQAHLDWMMDTGLVAGEANRDALRRWIDQLVPATADSSFEDAAKAHLLEEWKFQLSKPDSTLY